MTPEEIVTAAAKLQQVSEDIALLAAQNYVNVPIIEVPVEILDEFNRLQDLKVRIVLAGSIPYDTSKDHNSAWTAHSRIQFKPLG